MDNKEEILKGLEPLFKEARENGLWFYCASQGIWISPDELEAHQANGTFVWGENNWRLLHPKDHLEYLRKKVEMAIGEVSIFEKRMGLK